MKFEVGQKVVVVFNERRNERIEEFEVTKIGRVWAQISAGGAYEYRFNLESLLIDGGQYMSPGRIYLSREEYETEKATEGVWKVFRECVDRTWKPEISVEKIREAAKILGIDLTEGT